jgi:DNA polymerase elongation subunit (family B)
MSESLYKNILYLNIETVGSHDTLESCSKDDTILYELFINKCKRKSINNNVDINPYTEYLQKSPLYPEYGKIICCTMGLYKDNRKVIKTITGDEIDILHGITRVLNRYENNMNILYVCGYNIKQFDIPYICKKLLKYDMKIPRLIKTFNVKPWELAIIDIQDIFRFSGYEYIPLSEMCKSLDIPFDIITHGDKIHEEYWVHHNIDNIVKKSENDTNIIMDISFKVMKNI